MIACLLKGRRGAAAQQPHTEPSDSERQTGLQCFGLRSSSFFPALRLCFAALRLRLSAALRLCFFAAFQEGAALLKDVGKGLDSLCSEHGDARLSEVGNALEDRGSGQMTASVEDTAVLVNAFHIDAQLFFQDVDLVVYGQDSGCCRRAFLPACLLRVDILPHLLEYPRMTKGSPSHHHGVYTIVVKGLFRLLWCGDVTIANDWDMNTRVVFHRFYQGPVSIAGIHLAARTSVNGQSLNAAVLQLFS